MGFVTIDGTEHLNSKCPACKETSYIDAMRFLEPEQKGKKKDAAKNIGGGFDPDEVLSGLVKGFNSQVVRENAEKVQRVQASRDGTMVLEWQDTWCSMCGTKYVRMCHLARST